MAPMAHGVQRQQKRRLKVERVVKRLFSGLRGLQMEAELRPRDRVRRQREGLPAPHFVTQCLCELSWLNFCKMRCVWVTFLENSILFRKFFSNVFSYF